MDTQGPTSGGEIQHTIHEQNKKRAGEIAGTVIGGALLSILAPEAGVGEGLLATGAAEGIADTAATVATAATDTAETAADTAETADSADNIAETSFSSSEPQSNVTANQTDESANIEQQGAQEEQNESPEEQVNDQDSEEQPQKKAKKIPTHPLVQAGTSLITNAIENNQNPVNYKLSTTNPNAVHMATNTMLNNASILSK